MNPLRATALCVLMANAAFAQPPDGPPQDNRAFQFVPISPHEVRVEDSMLVATVVAAAGPDFVRVSARRAEAWRRGERLARDKLHRYVDDVMAEARVPASAAAATHARLAAAHQVLPRTLVDGSCALRIWVKMSELRAVGTDELGLPWH